MDASLDLGAPASYVTAGRGIPVYSQQKDRVGTLMNVLADEQVDIFDGILVDTTIGAGGARFVDAPDVAEFYENGVVLNLSTTACGKLHRPDPGPGVLEATGDEPPPGALTRKLQRAWDLLSGKG